MRVYIKNVTFPLPPFLKVVETSLIKSLKVAYYNVFGWRIMLIYQSINVCRGGPVLFGHPVCQLGMLLLT